MTLTLLCVALVAGTARVVWTVVELWRRVPRSNADFGLC